MNNQPEARSAYKNINATVVPERNSKVKSFMHAKLPRPKHLGAVTFLRMIVAVVLIVVPMFFRLTRSF
jgi:hypothetical protein